jgi:hypothetical protein
MAVGILPQIVKMSSFAANRGAANAEFCRKLQCIYP